MKRWNMQGRRAGRTTLAGAALLAGVMGGCLAGTAQAIPADGSTHAAAKPAAKSAGRSVMLEDYTTTELKQRITRGCPVVLIFSGGTEETGPHIALGKHGARANAYAQAIARNLGDALVAPALPFAPNSAELGEFAGTISLKASTFAAVNEEIARSMIGGGFQRIALLGDHGPSQRPLADVAAKLDKEFARSGARVFYISQGYTRSRAEIEDEIRNMGRVAGGHGGLWDTAETLAVAPDLVRTNRLHAGDVTQEGNGPINAEGFSGDPRGATAAMGRHFGALRVGYATAELKAALRAAGPCHD